MAMKAMVFMVSLVLFATVPATATTWDFSWSSLLYYHARPPYPDSDVSGHASGRNTATITVFRPPGRELGLDVILSINFEGGRVDVFDVPSDGDGLEAYGASIPVFIPPLSSEEEGVFTLFEDFAIGSYQWTGRRDQPDSFYVTLFSPGSGPDPERSFSGTGVRHVEASEPGTAVVLVLGFAAAIWARRRPRLP